MLRDQLQCPHGRQTAWRTLNVGSDPVEYTVLVRCFYCGQLLIDAPEHSLPYEKAKAFGILRQNSIQWDPS